MTSPVSEALLDEFAQLRWDWLRSRQRVHDIAWDQLSPADRERFRDEVMPFARRYAEVSSSLLSSNRMMAICAFRHALGRVFAELHDVAGWLVTNVAMFSPEDRATIALEIDTACGPKGAGMLNAERELWAGVRTAMLTGEAKP